ncbi:MAG: methylated-DNA--[protein]-cysteine S-methyltransferase [Pseudomonadota bacterium]
MPTATLETVFGQFAVTEADGLVTRIRWGEAQDGTRGAKTSPLLEEAVLQLKAYFVGRLRDFDLPLATPSDPFRQAVSAAMLAIPYGETRTYGEIAADLGSYGQPVGAACGSNKIPIVVPCHRVLSASGIGGFSAPGGVETKIALLRHEGGYPFLI